MQGPRGRGRTGPEPGCISPPQAALADAGQVFSFQVLGDYPVFFLLLISFLISLFSADITVWVISLLLNLLGLFLWTKD